MQCHGFSLGAEFPSRSRQAEEGNGFWFHCSKACSRHVEGTLWIERHKAIVLFCYVAAKSARLDFLPFLTYVISSRFPCVCFTLPWSWDLAHPLPIIPSSKRNPCSWAHSMPSAISPCTQTQRYLETFQSNDILLVPNPNNDSQTVNSVVSKLPPDRCYDSLARSLKKMLLPRLRRRTPACSDPKSSYHRFSTSKYRIQKFPPGPWFRPMIHVQ